MITSTSIGPLVAGVLDQPSQAGEVDDPIAHQAAAGEHVGGRHQPVADVVARDQAVRGGELVLEPRVPEHVVGVDHDAGVRAVEGAGERERLAERDDRRALADHHRMQRLDPQPHAVVGGEGEQPLDAGGDRGAGGAEVLAVRRAAHEHEDRRPELCRLLDRAAVVVIGVGRREEAAAAQARDPQAGILQRAWRIRRELVTPRGDPPDAGRRTPFGGLRQAPVVDGDQVEAEAAGVDHASSCRMRASASSGSRRSPARPARTNTSDRCSVERARSRPPSMEKLSWWPLSQARNTMPVL